MATKEKKAEGYNEKKDIAVEGGSTFVRIAPNVLIVGRIMQYDGGVPRTMFSKVVESRTGKPYEIKLGQRGWKRCNQLETKALCQVASKVSEAFDKLDIEVTEPTDSYVESTTDYGQELTLE